MEKSRAEDQPAGSSESKESGERSSQLNFDVITEPYDDKLRTLKILLDAEHSSCWFGDSEDDYQALAEQLKSDLADYNPQELFLAGKVSSDKKYADDPWEKEIIPFADDLSKKETEKAVIMIRTDDIPREK